MTLNPTVVEKMRKYIVDTAPIPITDLVYTNKDNTIHRHDIHTCHAGMSSLGAKPTIGCLIPGYNTNVAQDFLEWFVSDDSVYYPLIKHMGDNFHVVRDESNRVKGLIVDTYEVNHKLLTNFFKATRTVYEHSKALDFWKKWKIDRGKDPKICFVTSYFVDEKNQKITRPHSGIETNWAGGGFNLKVVAFPKENTSWNLTENYRNKNANYYGENNEAWGGGKFAFHKIPEVKLGEKLVTRFVHIYEKQKEAVGRNYTDETISNFLDNYKQFA